MSERVGERGRKRDNEGGGSLNSHSQARSAHRDAEGC